MSKKAMYIPVNSRAASFYKQVDSEVRVDGASPHELIQMLFDELLATLMKARGAMRRGDTGAKGHQIGRAIRILSEGLKAGLNPEQGGELAENLSNLYDYCSLRLAVANARNDEGILLEVVNLIEPIAQSWKQIKTNAHV